VEANPCDQDMQCVKNCDAPSPKYREHFEQPVLQTLQMFVGEMGCWLVIGAFNLYQRYASAKAGYEAIPDNDGAATPASDDTETVPIANPLRPVHADDEGRIPLEGRSILLLALPACCDIAGTTLMNIGLLFVAASIYQMTRGALVLFVGLFSVWFLKRHLGLYKWFSLFVVVTGVAVVGLAGAITRDDKASPGHQSVDASGSVDMQAVASQAAMTVVGVLLIAGAQIFTATQFVVEERIMEKYSMEPIKVVGWEGVFGFLVTFVGMVILHFAIGTGYFNAREGLYQMTHYRAIAVSSFLIMISIGYVFLLFRPTDTCTANMRQVVSTFSVSRSPALSRLPRARRLILAVRSSSGLYRWVLVGRRSNGSRLQVSLCWCTAPSCSTI